MSKYSTEQMIGDLTKALTEKDAIIDSQWALDRLRIVSVRLRAADALLSAAKKVRVSVQIYADPKDYAELEKAIAAYEGEGR